jgi:hypothetical protein
MVISLFIVTATGRRKDHQPSQPRMFLRHVGMLSYDQQWVKHFLAKDLNGSYRGQNRVSVNLDRPKHTLAYLGKSAAKSRSI